MIYSFLAILTGILLVFTTTFNSKLGTIKTVYISTFINFMMGGITSFLVFILFFNAGDVTFTFSKWYVLAGGLLAVFVVAVSNFLIAKIGVFFATLLSVAGQLIMGTVIDWIRFKEYPIWPTAGGILIVLGLLYIHRVEKIENKK